jgi:hypothetical protein
MFLLGLLEEHLVETVMKAIYVAGRFDKPGTVIALVLPVDQASGLESQMESFKKCQLDEKVSETDKDDVK